MRHLALLVLLLLPTTALALDCTPFQSWTCTQQGYFDVLDGVPGEVVCGVDYTGWTLHVIDVTLIEAGYIAFAGISAASSGNIVETAILLMDDCGALTCMDSVQGNGMMQLEACLDAGTYTFVVASNTTASTAFMNIGLLCPSCADIVAGGITCVYCQPVELDGHSWGSVKSRFE